MEVGAEVPDEVAAEGEDLSFGVEGEIGVVDLIPGMDTRSEVLGPGLHPLHRYAQLESGPHHRQFVGVQVEFGPEPASDIWRDDPQL